MGDRLDEPVSIGDADDGGGLEQTPRDFLRREPPAAHHEHLVAAPAAGNGVITHLDRNPFDQGDADRLHGGIIAPLRDAAMTHSLFARRVPGYTVRMELRSPAGGPRGSGRGLCLRDARPATVAPNPRRSHAAGAGARERRGSHSAASTGASPREEAGRQSESCSVAAPGTVKVRLQPPISPWAPQLHAPR